MRSQSYLTIGKIITNAIAMIKRTNARVATRRPPRSPVVPSDSAIRTLPVATPCVQPEYYATNS